MLKKFKYYLTLAFTALIVILVFNLIRYFTYILMYDPVIIGSCLVVLIALFFLTIGGLMVIFALMDYLDTLKRDK